MGQLLQRERALAVANLRRSQVKYLKACIKRDVPPPSELIAECQVRITVRNLLLAYPGFGARRVVVYCRAAQVSPDLVFGGSSHASHTLTAGARERLITAVMPWYEARLQRVGVK